MSEQFFRYAVIMLLGLILGSQLVAGHMIATTAGTVDYLSLKAANSR